MIEAAAAHATVIAATLLALAACVLLQHEYLIGVWRRLSRHSGHRRAKVLYGIASVILLHVTEIWIFGITWSASFTYLEMQRFWRPEAMDLRSEERGE